MRAAAYLARLAVRRHWRRMIAVAVLVGVVSAVVLATVAGARRTASALERFRRDSRSADVELAVAGEPTAAQLRELGRAPGVAAVGVLRAYGVQLPRVPSLQAIGVPVDRAFGVLVDRARLVRGRPVDSSAADEITVGEALARRLHVGVGDVVTVETYTPAQIASILQGADDVGPRAGPPVRLRIVGVERRPADLSNRAVSGGFLVLSPAFARAYRDRVGVFGSYVRVRVRNGAAGVPGTIRHARGIFGDSLFSAQGLSVETEGTRDAVHVLTTTLWILAGVVATVGAVLVGLVLIREISLLAVDDPTLRSLGVTRVQSVVACAPFALFAAGGGALLGMLGAVLTSPLFPTGVARRADPDVGLHADAAVLAAGAVVTIAVVLGFTFGAAARLVSRSAHDVRARDRRRPSTVADAAARFGLAPTVASGLRMALDRGRGRRSVPVWFSIVGAVTGVLGATAVLVFASNLDRLVATPRLYGWSWDFKSGDITANTKCGAGDYGLSHLNGVAATAEVCYQNVQVDGRPVAALAFRDLHGASIGPVVLDGRSPRSPSEVALGSKTLDALGKHVGDTVRVRGRDRELRYRVVGRVTLAPLGQAQPLADGAAFTGEGFAPLFDQNLFSRYFVGRYGSGADVASVRGRVAAIPMLDAPTGPSVPVEVDRIRQVRWFPTTLAGLLAGLGLFTVGHAVVTSIRRRRVDLAVLRTLGFDRGQIRAAIAWQATTLAIVGVVIGLPAGLVVGRLAWRTVANGLGIDPTVTVPVAVVLTIPAAIALVNLVALAPARAAARERPAVALRSE